MSEFKKGDRVRVDTSSSNYGGSVGTVVGSRADAVTVMLDGKLVEWSYCAHELELLHRHELVEQPTPVAHSHYFRPCPFDSIDVYRVLSIFSVVDPCLQHAVKKLLVAGGRGHKDIGRDVQDAIDTLVRWQAMRAEEAA